MFASLLSAQRQKTATTHIEDLPPEVMLMILHQLIGTDPEYSFDPILLSLCLVNRRWNEIFTPQLYACYQLEDNSDEFRTLWCFLRTLVTRPDLAQHVRQLTVSRHLIPVVVDYEDKLQSIKKHYDANAPWLQMAFNQAGWNEPSINRSRWGLDLAQQDRKDVTLAEIAAISNKYPGTDRRSHIFGRTFYEGYMSPLCALIIAHCPKLRRLAVPVHLVDPFLDEVLYWATYGAADPNRPAEIGLQGLESLSLWRQESFGCSRTAGHAVHSFDIPVCARPYYRLPRLKQLDTDEAFKDPGVFGDIEKPYQSNIQDLSARYPLEIFSVPAGTLLSRTSNLRQLSLTLVPCTVPTTRSTVMNYYSQLWNCLAHFSDTLEYLDIDQERDIDNLTPFPNDKDQPFCPPLSQFTKLKYLASTPLLLSGNRCPHEFKSPISSHLPRSLLALGLYCELSGPGSQAVITTSMGTVTATATTDPALEAELHQILTVGSANGLRALVVDHTRGSIPHHGKLENVALAAQLLGVNFICETRAPKLRLRQELVMSYPLSGGGLPKSAFLWLDDRELNKVVEGESPWVGGAGGIIPRGVKMYHKRKDRDDEVKEVKDKDRIDLSQFFLLLLLLFSPVPLSLGLTLGRYIFRS